MKYSILVLLFLVSQLNTNAQNGKYAGSKKSLIGQVYTDSRSMPGMKGWTFKEGGLMNSPNDPEWFMSEVYQRGTTAVVIISIKEDTASATYTILDVIEIKGVVKGWTIRTGTCREYKTNNAWLIVWGKETTQEYMKTIKKAWRFNPDKRRVEAIPVKGIDCENIGC